MIEQLGNLRTHPSVAARLEQGDLQLHGWVYDLGEGVVTAYDPDQAAFVPAGDAQAEARAGRRS